MFEIAKRVQSLIFLALLFAALIPNGAAIETESQKLKVKEVNMHIPHPETVAIGAYDWLKIPECSYISTPGHPRLPVKSIVVKLPLGSVIKEVELTVQNVTVEGFYQIVPSPAPKPLSTMEDLNDTTEPDLSIYESQNLYPEEWFSYRTANGLDEESRRRVTYILIYFYPLRYLPKQRTITCGHQVSATIVYREPLETPIPTEQLDNIIITSPLLEPQALRLGQWKNDTFITTRVLNTNWIYYHYPGIDHQMQIRNCIKDFVLNQGTRFVTIFGDADQVPVRYAYIPDPEVGETNVPTDLYYADLDGSWDDNLDGLYADQRYDDVDGIPDVYVGRIPPSVTEYAQAAVDKIKGYQQQFDPSQDWSQRIVLGAGTPNGFGTGFFVLKEYIADIVSDKDLVKLYQSSGNLSTGSMFSEINKGALFVNFAGHGAQDMWLFYWIIKPFWWNGYGIVDVQKLTNGFKLPVVTADSCSTARFDDTDCIGEWFVLEPDGGSIAYFGATRIAWGYVGEWSPTGLMGEMDWRIYENFNAGHTELGQMWGETVGRYVQNHIWNYQSAGTHDVKTFMEFVLLGDPTLNVGHYMAEIEAYDTTESSSVSVSFTWDEASYTTPRTFTDLTESHQVVAAEEDKHGHPFVQWLKNDLAYSTDRATTVSSGGVYTAIYAATPILYVDPSSATRKVGETFSMNVSIAHVFNLWAYEFKLYYNNAILECIDGELPPDHFLKPKDPTKLSVAIDVREDFNATHGRVLIGVSLLAPELPKSGSGTLVRITFVGVNVGDSLLNLDESMLINYDAELIPHLTTNSQVLVQKLDTAISFTLSPNPANPGQSATLQGTLLDENNDPVFPADVEIEYSQDNENWYYLWTLNANSAGEFSRTFTAPSVGVYYVRASHAGSAMHNPSSHTETFIVRKLDTTISFTLSPNPANPGDTVLLQGTLLDENNDPVSSAGVRIEYSLDLSTWNYLWTLTTDGGGDFSRTFTAPSVNTYYMRASYLGSATYNPSDHTETFIVQTPTLVETWIYFNFNPNPATPGTSVTLRGILVDESGNRGKYLPIRIEYSKDDGATWNYLWTLTADSYGIFSRTFWAPTTGRYLLRASWGGSSTHTPASSTTYFIVLSSTPLKQAEAAANAIFFNFFPNPVTSGTSDALRGILLDNLGNPISSASVSVQYSTNNGATWNSLWTLTTDANGIFSTTFTAPAAGTYLLRATHGGLSITTYLVVLS